MPNYSVTEIFVSTKNEIKPGSNLKCCGIQILHFDVKIYVLFIWSIMAKQRREHRYCFRLTLTNSQACTTGKRTFNSKKYFILNWTSGNLKIQISASSLIFSFQRWDSIKMNFTTHVCKLGAFNLQKHAIFLARDVVPITRGNMKLGWNGYPVCWLSGYCPDNFHRIAPDNRQPDNPFPSQS